MDTRKNLKTKAAETSKDIGHALGFMRLLWKIDHGLQSTSKQMERAFGITGPQRLVIRIVNQYPGISAGELAKILLVDPSTLTGVLKRLEKRKALKRLADPEDGRRALFELTDTGRALADENVGTVESAVRRTLARVPIDVLLSTQVLLQVLAEELSL